MSETERPVLPDWTRAPFHEFLEHHKNLTRVLHLAIAGIQMMRQRHEILVAIDKAMERFDGSGPESEELQVAAAQRELAQSEIDNDFPLLHEQATVAMWGSLEALIRGFLASWLQNNPEAWRAEGLKKLKVRLGEYETLDPSVRCLWVVDLLDNEISGPLRTGVTRFECLLHQFGLDGSVDETQSRSLFELSQVRNAIVHNRGRADRRLIESCPWLDLKLGDKVRVSHQMWTGHSAAVAQYVLELIQRVRVRMGFRRVSHDEIDADSTPETPPQEPQMDQRKQGPSALHALPSTTVDLGPTSPGQERLSIGENWSRTGCYAVS